MEGMVRWDGRDGGLVGCIDRWDGVEGWDGMEMVEDDRE